MANKYANLVGTNKIKDEYSKINTGFDQVEADINDVNSRITTLDNRVDTGFDQVEADIKDINSRITTLDNRVDTGFDQVEADINDVNSRITALDNRVDEIITTPIDDEVVAQEIVNARAGFSTIGDRMTNIEEDIETRAQEIADIQEDIETHTQEIAYVKSCFSTIGDRMTNIEEDIETHKADYTLQIPYGGTTTNSGNNYSIATPAISALTAGMAISVQINADSTGACTLNWNGKGAKPIKKANGNDVTNLKANGIYTFRYDGSNFILQGEGGEYGNVTPDKVLEGTTFGTEDGVILGTMPDNGTKIITPSTVNQAIPAGYHNGQGYVVGSVNLISENIKEGVNIFGIIGSLEPRKYASGTFTTSYYVEKDSTIYFTVTSSLSFTPIVVAIDWWASSAVYVKTGQGKIINPTEANFCTKNTLSAYRSYAKVQIHTITNGFKLKFMSTNLDVGFNSPSFDWMALG